MAGHSKWKNIQHRKNKQDATRGKIFTKLIREITVAAKQGGDVDTNPRLRLAREKALAFNMAKDTILRAVERGVASSGGSGSDYEEVRYEGYGPNKVAMIIDSLTDNKNRTVGEIRHALMKFGGNLALNGAVSYLFKTRGILCFAASLDEDKIMTLALEADADDVIKNDEGIFEVFTLPESFTKTQNLFINNGFAPEHAEITTFAQNEIFLEKEEAEKILALIELLENLDDVQNVYTNANLDDFV